MVPVDHLRQIIAYDPDTGSFTWLARDRASFASEGAYSNFKRKFAGQEAFPKPGVSGYRETIITYQGRRFNLRAHQIAFALSFGRYPTVFIDHANGDRADNRLANLREATQQQNVWNAERLPTAGTKRARGGRWEAFIRIGGKKKYLGNFPTRELAHAAYVAASNEVAGDFSPFKRPSHVNTAHKNSEVQ